MKNRLKRLLFISTSALMCFGVAAAAVPQGTSSVVLAEEEHKFDEVVTDWFTIRARSEKATVENPEGVAELEILLSPVFQDYEKANGDSFSKFLDSKTGLIGAIKYILADQVKFIEPVDDPVERETEDFNKEYGQRTSIFEQFLKATFELDESYGVTDQEHFNEQYEAYSDVMLQTFDDMNNQVINNGKTPTAGNFLRAVLAYFAGKTIEDETLTEPQIADLLGINSGEYEHSALGDALNRVYENVSYYDDDDRREAVKNDIETIYGDAVQIATGVKPESLAIAEIFLLAEETTIKVETIVDILGVDTVKEAILDCFKDKDDNGVTISNPISASAVNSMLKEFSSDTIFKLCKKVGFTKGEIKSVIKDNMTNDRLMELSKDLGKEGLDNIRIILGTANDNDVKKSLKIKRASSEFDFADHYGEFGNELVDIVLGRMSISDMLNAVEAVWVRNVGEDATKDHLLYSYNYPMDDQYAPFVTYDNENNNPYKDGRAIHVRDIIEWLNQDFPKLDYLKNRTNDNFKLQYHFEVLSPLTEGRIHCDLTVGFQEGKNVKPITNILSIIDDGMDLTFDFVEGEGYDVGNYENNTLKYELTIRPRFFSNIYNFVLNNFVFNTDDNRLKDRLFELTYMTFGDMKDAVNNLRAEQLIADCHNLDYETAINTLLYYDRFIELFKGTPFTWPQVDGQTPEEAYMSNITRIITNLRKFANKGESLTYENIRDIIADKLSEGIANKLNNAAFKNFLNDLVNLCIEIKDQHISLEGFRAIQNEDVYANADTLLDNKLNTVKRLKKLVYKILMVIPDEYDDYTIMDFFVHDERKIVINEGYKLVWEEIFGMKAIANLIEDFIVPQDRLGIADPMITIELDTNLQEGEPKVYTVSYHYTIDGVEHIRSGLLPAGTNINDCGPGVVEGEDVLYWTDNTTGERVDVMPESDVDLGPVFITEIDFSDVTWDYVEPFEYDGEAHKVQLTNLPEGLGTLYTITYTNNEKTASGTYIASAIVTLVDDTEYEIVNLNIEDLEWKINEPQKTKISFANTRWDYTGPFDFDGEAHKVQLAGLPEGLNSLYTITYTNNEKTASGTYLASAVVELINDEDYEIVDLDIGTLEWKINERQKTKISFAETQWDYVGAFDFDGESHKVQLIGLPEGLNSLYTVTYTNNEKTASGTYTAVAVIELINDEEYEIVNLDIDALEWKINEAEKQKISFAETEWDYTNPFEFDGLAHKVELKGLPAGRGTIYEISYFDNEKTSVGTYQASAAVQILDDNYEAVDFNPGNLEWKIFEPDKQKISFKNTAWDSTNEFNYDGDLHEVKLVGLPEGEGTIYRINYQDNENYKPGTYEARATVELIDKSYTVVDFNVGVLQWKISTTIETLYYDFCSIEESDAGDSFIIVHINDGLVKNPDLHAIRNDEAFDEFEINPDEIYGAKAILHSAYDISFKENEVTYDVSAFDGKVSVLIPEELRANNEFVIISLKNAEEFEKVSFEISEDGKYAIFDSEFISKIAIISALENLEGLFDPLPIIIFIIGLTNIALCAFLLIYKKNKEEEEKKPSKKENKKTQGKPEPKAEEKEAKSKK